MNTAHGRIQKDLVEVVTTGRTPDMPPIFAQTHGEHLDHVDALVVGPPETPYAFGFYRFDFRFPATYPNNPPKVLITTTDSGRTRFNPNLYAGGKVCLSILGTWSGESADEWRSSYSIAYVLRAVQSLIMNQKPYHNEPGYEEASSNATGRDGEVEQYSRKIAHENLRVAVCGAIEEALNSKAFDQFHELVKEQYLLWYHSYLRAAEDAAAAEPPVHGTPFAICPFEHQNNVAAGRYDYELIVRRLKAARALLDQETDEWKEKGKALTKAEAGRRYFSLLEEADKIKRGETQLEGISAGPATEDNVFLWAASIFGPEGSDWEGGIFNLELVFAENDFCRVRFTTDVFHPHVTPDGIPFYTLPRTAREPVVPILKALEKLLKSPPNSSPATWANPEAARMYFSKDEEQRKEYKKRVARCVRRSVEG